MMNEPLPSNRHIYDKIDNDNTQWVQEYLGIYHKMCNFSAKNVSIYVFICIDFRLCLYTSLCHNFAATANLSLAMHV